MAHYEINTEIVFSTAHITDSTASSLSKENGDLYGILIIYPYKYGWRIFVPIESDFDGTLVWLIENGFNELVSLLTIARDMRCKWLVIDSDGPVYDHVKQYDW
jgi:hypothetical protein